MHVLHWPCCAVDGQVYPRASNLVCLCQLKAILRCGRKIRSQLALEFQGLPKLLFRGGPVASFLVNFPQTLMSARQVRSVLSLGWIGNRQPRQQADGLLKVISGLSHVISCEESLT